MKVRKQTANFGRTLQLCNDRKHEIHFPFICHSRTSSHDPPPRFLSFSLFSNLLFNHTKQKCSIISPESQNKYLAFLRSKTLSQRIMFFFLSFFPLCKWSQVCSPLRALEMFCLYGLIDISGRSSEQFHGLDLRRILELSGDGLQGIWQNARQQALIIHAQRGQERH